MLFKQAIIKSVKADLAAGTITLSFTISTDEQKAAEELAFYVGKDASDMTLEVLPHTPAMKFVHTKAEVKALD